MSDWIVPDWPAPPRVRALSTTRSGGASLPPYASLNLGDHVGDDPDAVAENRARLRAHLPARLPAEPLWLTQVHGVRVVDADDPPADLRADASVARQAGAVCAVMTADCLPVLLCDAAGTAVAAAHAGWRGLAGGVIEATVAAMDVPAASLVAWLGPAIGPQSFEVGEEVRAAFVGADARAAAAFAPAPGDKKWLADIYLLARRRLEALGVASIHGGEWCTVRDAARFHSYRRDGVCGRMASLVWIETERPNSV